MCWDLARTCVAILAQAISCSRRLLCARSAPGSVWFFSSHSCSVSSAMPRKGWSTVQVPDGWLKVIRALSRSRRDGRPDSLLPIKMFVKAAGNNVPSNHDNALGQLPRQEPLDPDAMLAHAKARVAKLEAAMQVVGESDPTYLALHDALRRARAQAELRPVQERISATETFLQRARKWAEKDLQEVRCLWQWPNCIRVDCAGEGSVASSSRGSRRCASFSVPPPTGPVRLYAGIGAIASFSARIDATSCASHWLASGEEQGSGRSFGRALDRSCSSSTSPSSLIETLTYTQHEEGRPKDVRDEQRRRGLAVQSRVEKGRAPELVMNRQAALAPQNNETLGELRGR